MHPTPSPLPGTSFQLNTSVQLKTLDLSKLQLFEKLTALPKVTVQSIPSAFLLGLNPDLIKQDGTFTPLALAVLQTLQSNGAGTIETARAIPPTGKILIKGPVTPDTAILKPAANPDSQPLILHQNQALAAPLSPKLVAELLTLQVTFPPGKPAATFAAALRNLPGVWFVDPVRMLTPNPPESVTSIRPPKTTGGPTLPDGAGGIIIHGLDVLDDWHKQQIGYYDPIHHAGQLTPASQYNQMKVSNIAVLDNGCDNLENVTWVETVPSSSAEHGTQVVSTIQDLLPNAGLTVLRITEANDIIDKTANSFKLTKYLFALRDIPTLPGIRVVNISRGQPDWTMAEWDAIDNLEKAGILVVAAAGNSLDQTDLDVDYPAGFPTVLSVGALTVYKTGAAKVWDYSCYSLNLETLKCLKRKTSGVDIVAPGGGIFIQGQELWGTSFAAPIVSALAGLLFTLRPKLTPADVRSIITTTFWDPSWDKLDANEIRDAYGRGIVNWQGAIEEALKRPQ